jgi:hypothetical protein
VDQDHVSDNEILLRRIPPSSPWFEPPDRIASFNFKLKPCEMGLSVYRERIVSRQEVLDMPRSRRSSMASFCGMTHLTAPLE